MVGSFAFLGWVVDCSFHFTRNVRVTHSLVKLEVTRRHNRQLFLPRSFMMATSAVPSLKSLCICACRWWSRYTVSIPCPSAASTHVWVVNSSFSTNFSTSSHCLHILRAEHNLYLNAAISFRRFGPIGAGPKSKDQIRALPGVSFVDMWRDFPHILRSSPRLEVHWHVHILPVFGYVLWRIVHPPVGMPPISSNLVSSSTSSEIVAEPTARISSFAHIVEGWIIHILGCRLISFKFNGCGVVQVQMYPWAPSDLK